MERSYETFVEELRGNLLVALKMDESRIYFRKKGEGFADAGDRLFVECVSRKETREVCGIYTKEMYEHYRYHGNTMEDIVGEICKELDRVKRAGIFEGTKRLMDYEKAKKELFIRLLNADRNKKDLTHAIYRSIGDIAMVLYMRVAELDGCITSVKIREDYLEKWGMDREKVFDEALLNTYYMAPPRIYRWEQLWYDMDYQGDDFMDPVVDYKLNRQPTGNCLSTAKRTNGAVAVFMPGVAKRLGALLGDDMYLVFTSIHEVMIHSERVVDSEDLEAVLADTLKEATPEEDYLTSSIYRYNRDTDTFSCVRHVEGH